MVKKDFQSRLSYCRVRHHNSFDNVLFKNAILLLYKAKGAYNDWLRPRHQTSGWKNPQGNKIYVLLYLAFKISKNFTRVRHFKPFVN